MAKSDDPRGYYLYAKGRKVPVSEEVYREHRRAAWRTAKQEEVRRKRERSLEGMREDGFDVASDEKPVDEIVAEKMLLDELYAALNELTDDERALMDMFFYRNKSEREAAKEIGIPRNTFVYRKNRILNKLKKIIEKSR